MKQEINYEVKTGKYTNMWRLKFTDNHWVKELKGKSRNTLRQIKTQHTILTGFNTASAEREI